MKYRISQKWSVTRTIITDIIQIHVRSPACAVDIEDSRLVCCWCDVSVQWKELESQHNPKAGIYKYAETKIKCKLSVPAKYRAADATKRGLEEEAAAAAAAAAVASAG